MLAASGLSMLVSYTDVTKQPGQLNDICLNMAIGKVVAVDPKSIKETEINGEKVTLGKIIK